MLRTLIYQPFSEIDKKYLNYLYKSIDKVK
nr:MAG TPA: hypothetical protein [Caudoviricetes sp.]